MFPLLPASVKLGFKLLPDVRRGGLVKLGFKLLLDVRRGGLSMPDCMRPMGTWAAMPFLTVSLSASHECSWI